MFTARIGSIFSRVRLLRRVPLLSGPLRFIKPTEAYIVRPILNLTPKRAMSTTPPVVPRIKKTTYYPGSTYYKTEEYVETKYGETTYFFSCGSKDVCIYEMDKLVRQTRYHSNGQKLYENIYDPDGKIIIRNMYEYGDYVTNYYIDSLENATYNHYLNGILVSRREIINGTFERIKLL